MSDVTAALMDVILPCVCVCVCYFLPSFSMNTVMADECVPTSWMKAL